MITLIKYISTTLILLSSQHLMSQDFSKRMASYNYGNKELIISRDKFEEEKELTLKVDQDDLCKKEVVDYIESQYKRELINAYTGYLYNNTKTTVNLRTQDRSLIMILEALDSLGNWRPIEYWGWSWCGNSYFNLGLEKGTFVKFKVPIYEGEIETKMRLKLPNKDEIIYSNEFISQVSEEQLYEIMKTEKKNIFLDGRKN